MRQLLLVLVLVSAGCDCSGEPMQCSSDAECASDEQCRDGVCVARSVDAGAMDTGTPPPDSGSDAGCPSGGVFCNGACCPATEACRRDACFTEISCTDHDDCLHDSYCDTDGFCTPYERPSDVTTDEMCERPAEMPDRFAAEPQCAFTAAPSGDASASHIEAHATVTVADLDLDGDPSTIAPSIVYNGALPHGGCGRDWTILRVLDGATCEQQFAMHDVAQRTGGGSVAAADLDGDGRPEIISLADEGGLIAFRYDTATSALVVHWRSADRTNLGSCTGPSVADLDDDGVPEIQVGEVVYDASGALVTTGPSTVEIFAGTYKSFGVTADVDLDGVPELVLHDGTYEWDSTGNVWVLETYWARTASRPAGWVAVADFGDFPAAAGDAPGRPEVVVAGSGEIRVQSIGGDLVFGPISRGIRGGPPTIADFDGDGRAELGAADHAGYRVFRPDVGLLWEVASQDNSSGVTGSSVFDFEGDGSAEVIYADECFLRVYDGATGTVLYSEGRTSCTWAENPIVVDVDGDFHSEMVLPLDSSCAISCPAVDPVFSGLRCGEDAHCPSGAGCAAGVCTCSADAECGARHGCRSGACRAIAQPRRAGVEVLRDSLDRWAPSRPIWNQHAYSVTHVDDRGVVPSTSTRARNWDAAGLNNFRQNVQGSFDPLAAADLTVGEGRFARDCTVMARELGLSARVCNRGTDGVPMGVRVTFHDGDPSTEPVCEASTTGALLPGECQRVSCVWNDAPVMEEHDITVVVDTGDTQLECHEGNNRTTIERARCPSLE